MVSFYVKNTDISQYFIFHYFFSINPYIRRNKPLYINRAI